MIFTTFVIVIQVTAVDCDSTEKLAKGRLKLRTSMKRKYTTFMCMFFKRKKA
jgi:hypothetical protein